MPRLARKGPANIQCRQQGCEAAFSTTVLRDNHERLHEDEDAFECPDCETRHHCQKQLTDCLQSHVKGVQRYFCQDLNCDLSYTRTNAYKDHVQLHADAFAFFCDVCGKAHSSSGNKRDCERKHNGTFRCDVPDCSRTFKSPGELATHSKRHAGIREHACNELDCDAAYVTAHALFLHQCAKHGLAQPKKCKLCPDQFVSALELDGHMSHVHYNDFLVFDLSDERVLGKLQNSLAELKEELGDEYVKAAIKPDRDDQLVTGVSSGQTAVFWTKLYAALEKAKVLITYDLKRQVRSYFDPTKAQGTNRVTISGAQMDELQELVAENGWHRFKISMELGVSDAVVDSWFLRFGEAIADDLGTTKPEMLALARTRMFDPLG